MRKRTLLAATSILAILGVIDSAYLAEHALTNTALSCGIGSLSGCNIVAHSQYSHLLGIPLGIYGLVFYILVLVCCIANYQASSPRLRIALFASAVIGIVFSFYFVGLQLFVIKAICIYCLGSFLLSLGIFGLTSLLLRVSRGPLPAAM